MREEGRRAATRGAPTRPAATRWGTFVAALCASLLATTSAHAETAHAETAEAEPAELGPFEAGLTAGVGAITGVSPSLAMTILARVAVNVLRYVDVGAEAGLVEGLSLDEDVDEECPRCNPSGFRVGGRIHVHIRPGEVFDPYLGYGVHFERLTMTGTKYLGDVNMHWTDVCLLDAQVGLDVRPKRGAVAFGPFVELSKCSQHWVRTFEEAPARNRDEDYAKGAINVVLGLGFSLRL
jgi:hypothetical protein